jgi:uncharacterized FAD-dependent dehydrogenase
MRRRRHYSAPGQRWGISSPGAHRPRFGEVIPSYKPGVRRPTWRRCLPGFRGRGDREALPAFGRQIARYDHPGRGDDGRRDAHLLAHPHPRGADFQSLNTRGLFPAGEGAGYAGGILSAASTASRWRRPSQRSMMAR